MSSASECSARAQASSDPGCRQPRSVGAPEIAEATAGAVEGIAQEPQTASSAGLDDAPAEIALMEHVDQQAASHVVSAIAMIGVRPRALRVLHDPDLGRQDLEVATADWMERRRFRHWAPGPRG